MKRLAMALSMTMILFSCAAAQTEPRDPIVGVWHGLGIWQEMTFIARQDNSVLWGEDQLHWKRTSDGAYVIYQGLVEPQGATKAKLDDRGRLVIGDDPDSQRFLVKVDYRNAKPEPTPDPNQLPGTWRYAYTKMAVYPVASNVDEIYFGKDGSMLTISTLAGKGGKGQYQAEGNSLSLSLLALPFLKQHWTYRLEDGGKTLVLASPDWPDYLGPMKWVYLRSDAFIKSPPLGTWVTERGGMARVEWQILPDGRLEQSGKNLRTGAVVPMEEGSHASYSCWRSGFGDTITIVYPQTVLGALSVMAQYKRTGDTLRLTPIEWGPDAEMRLEPRAAETWRLKKAGAPTER